MIWTEPDEGGDARSVDRRGERKDQPARGKAKQARPCAGETAPLSLADAVSTPSIFETGRGVYLRLDLGPAARKAAGAIVTGERLGKARVPGLGYENPDGSPLRIDTDYLGRPRDAQHPAAGPFEDTRPDPRGIKVW